MFSPNPKNDPLLAAIKGVIAENDKHRDAVDRANKHFKITDKRQLPHNLHAEYDSLLKESNNLSEKITKSTPMGDVISDFEQSDAPQFAGKSKEKRREMAIAAKMSMMKEELKGDQHKIDANKNNRIDAHDFKLLRKMDEDVMLEAITNLLKKDTLSESEYNTIMESAFGDAFKAARKAGKAEFEFNGKMFHSRQKGETESQWKAGLAKNAPPVPLPRPADRMPTGTGFDPTDPLRREAGIEVPAAVPVNDVPTQVRNPPLGGRQGDFVPRIEYQADRMPNQQEPAAVTMRPSATGTSGVGANVNTGVRQPTATQVSVPASGMNINQIGQQADNARLSGYRDIQQAGPSTGPAMQPTAMNKPETQMVAGQNVRNDLAGNIPTQVTQPSTVRGYGNDSLATTIKSMFADRIKR